MDDSKVIFITGAGKRLGKSLAIGLSRAGHKVVATGVDDKELTELKPLLNENSLALLCDITVPESCQRAVDAAVEKFGHIDILINNAGVYIESQFSNSTASQLNSVYDVVVKGTALITTTILNSMTSTGSHIICILDARTKQQLPDFTTDNPYGTVDLAAKLAKKQFTDIIRTEFSTKGVAVTGMYLHWVASDLSIDGNEVAPDGATHPRDVVADMYEVIRLKPADFDVRSSPR